MSVSVGPIWTRVMMQFVPRQERCRHPSESLPLALAFHWISARPDCTVNTGHTDHLAMEVDRPCVHCVAAAPGVSVDSCYFSQSKPHTSLSSTLSCCVHAVQPCATHSKFGLNQGPEPAAVPQGCGRLTHSEGTMTLFYACILYPHSWSSTKRARHRSAVFIFAVFLCSTPGQWIPTSHVHSMLYVFAFATLCVLSRRASRVCGLYTIHAREKLRDLA